MLETADLEESARRLEEHGVAIEGGVQQAPWGRYVQFTDPDGNGLILQASTPGGSRFTESGSAS